MQENPQALSAIIWLLQYLQWGVSRLLLDGELLELIADGVMLKYGRW